MFIISLIWNKEIYVWDLHSEPPNPQLSVKSWLNSTIELDTNRRTMDIN